MRETVMPTTVLAAGDHFVLPSLLADAVRAEAGDQVEIRELTLPWPHVPFGPVAESAAAGRSMPTSRRPPGTASR
jgi:hypothetical protein